MYRGEHLWSCDIRGEYKIMLILETIQPGKKTRASLATLSGARSLSLRFDA
jgi:hypothetical protein